MKKLFLVAGVTALQATFVFASGDHASGHHDVTPTKRVAQNAGQPPAKSEQAPAANADQATGVKSDAAVTSMTDGEVRKIDKAAKKITLKHGEIKNLEMPPMTMVFQVKDPAVLDKVKVGDKVQFSAEQVGGATVVTSIDAVK